MVLESNIFIIYINFTGYTRQVVHIKYMSYQYSIIFLDAFTKDGPLTLQHDRNHSLPYDKSYSLTINYDMPTVIHV